MSPQQPEQIPGQMDLEECIALVEDNLGHIDHSESSGQLPMTAAEVALRKTGFRRLKDQEDQ